MRQLLRQIEKLGRTRWPVLIQGETGTGKELIARAIYDANPVGPFVVVDCSSLVGPLMESELFGYSKGAFTGAAQKKLGLIESAQGGTVFLDEIGELPLDLQMKLLRVLQEKEFRAVGAITPKKVDFRVISATNRDLAAEVEDGKFRRDLFYRLNVVTLRLPALRERTEDIPVLVRHFLDRDGKNYAMTDDVLNALTNYPWPGNVRELEHSIQHMMAVNSGPLLHRADLPSAILNQVPEAAVASVRALAAAVGSAEAIQTDASPSPFKPTSSPMAFDTSSTVLPLAEVEKRAILDALRHTKGDRAMAAALLGIGRTTLYRKLKEYEPENPAHHF
jgi:DNA-binding NtrC family response regulator